MREWCARTGLVAFSLVLITVMAVDAEAADALQARLSSGDLVLSADGGGARLEFPDGHSLPLGLPEGAEMSSLAADGDRWWAAGAYPSADGGSRLVVVGGDGLRARRLPVPGGQSRLSRRSPVLLVDGARLAGLAWLEGDGPRSLAVASAQARDDGSWRRPVWVSNPGPGSQVALTGAVLADGSWLLAWSAFDGLDDEIVWSRRVGEQWLPATRLSADNGVPDITPALTPAGSGALLAWSRYDGDSYRLMLARYSGGAWSDERVAGGPGTLYPSFAGDRDRPCLLYFTAQPRSWIAEDLTPEGEVLRRVERASVGADRPVVTSARGELRLAWPGDEAGAEER